MAWRYHSDDKTIEVIVDTDFGGDLMALASRRPVWIVDSPLNCPRIDAIWAVGSESNLCEVNRCQYSNSDDRKGNFLDILGCLDDHYPYHDIAVHGIHPPELGTALQDEGFRITRTTGDGFVAAQIPDVRDSLTGRA